MKEKEMPEGAIFNFPCLLHALSLSQATPQSKLILPSPLTSLSLSPQGSHLACGLESGQLLFYHLSTGQLLSSFSAHYRAITVLKFTKDGKGLISGGKDSRISVWSVASLVNHRECTSNEEEGGKGGAEMLINPYTTFNDHSLPITDIWVDENTDLLKGKVWSCSLDGSVKVSLMEGRNGLKKCEVILWDINSEFVGRKEREREGGGGRTDVSGALLDFSPSSGLSLNLKILSAPSLYSFRISTTVIISSSPLSYGPSQCVP